MPYTLEQIASFIGAHLWGREEAEVSWLLTDSRSLCFPEDTLFFALETRRNDGHRYIPELYQRGVRSFVVSRLPEDLAAYPDASFLQVLCPLKALQRLAERRREEFDIPVVGITGSNGKTIVKEWLYQLLSPEKAVARSPRSYNSQIGVPLSVWGLNEQSEVGLFEAGISQCGEMDALQSIIQPTVGVFTCLGEAHRENFSSKEQKCMEKLKLFKDAQVLVYGIDDPCVAACVNLSAFKGEYMAWSLTRRDVPVAVSAVEKEGSTTRVTYIYKGRSMPTSSRSSTMPRLPTPCRACVSASIWVWRPTIARRMEVLEPVAMRLEVIEGRAGCTSSTTVIIGFQFARHRPRLHEPQAGACRTEADAHLEGDIAQTAREPMDFTGG